MLNVLLMFPQSLWFKKMSSVRRHAMEVMLERTDIRTKLTGQGWPNYDMQKSLRENIQRVFPEADCIFWYKPVGDDPVKVIHPEDRDIPACASYNECWWPNWMALRECQDTRTEMVICHHQSDLRQFDGPGPKIPHVLHMPHAARTEIYLPAAQSWSRRDIPALLTGAVSHDTYPLRATLRDCMTAGLIPGKVRQHPSYLMRSLEACNKQTQDYARQMGYAKAVYVCGSKFNYGLAKYVEAAMAGACLIGDIPPDYEKTLGPHMVRLDAGMKKTRLVEIINKALADDDRLKELAAGGQAAASEHHSMDGYVTKLIGHLQTLVT